MEDMNENGKTMQSCHQSIKDEGANRLHISKMIRLTPVLLFRRGVSPFFDYRSSFISVMFSQ